MNRPDIRQRLISVSDFTRMAGRKHRSWYYRHMHETGMPPMLVGPEGTRMLDYDACLAYIARFQPKEKAS